MLFRFQFKLMSLYKYINVKITFNNTVVFLHFKENKANINNLQPN